MDIQPETTAIDLTRTICAIATPPGRGGLGIVRLSGPKALRIADLVFRGRHSLSGQQGFTAHLGSFVCPQSHSEIDEVIATVFHSPKSYTGEDLIEFSAHGGAVVLKKIIATLTDNGANMALPGEFTLRAFLNGRIDLTEAEAVADLISAKTERSAESALKQLKGYLHDEILALRQTVLGVLSHTEIGIDFTEEDLESGDMETIRVQLETVADKISRLLSGYRRGHILRDGFVVVLAGPPNVGKSTLFNRLAQDDLAIVTDTPGTTRDLLRAYINLKGWPVCLIDTAGMREADNPVERIGVGRSTAAMTDADGVIWMIDALEDWRDQLPDTDNLPPGAPSLICINKSDRAPNADAIREGIETVAGPWNHHSPVVAMSALHGDGIDRLLTHIESWVTQGTADDSDHGATINDRHRLALQTAQQSVQSALTLIAQQREIELVAFDMKAAAGALGEIIGETATDDILAEIFGSFCIGK